MTPRNATRLAKKSRLSPVKAACSSIRWWRSSQHAWIPRPDLRFCCSANVVTAGEAREPDVTRDSSNRVLDSQPVQPTLILYTMAYTDG